MPQRAVFWWRSKRIFPSKNVLIRTLKRRLSRDGWCRTEHRATELHGCQTERYFFSFCFGSPLILVSRVTLIGELNLLCFATTIAGFLRSTASWLFFDDRQICLRDGKTLKVVLCTEFCPLCDKQVSEATRAIFLKTLKIRVKLILNCPRAHAITYTKHPSYF